MKVEVITSGSPNWMQTGEDTARGTLASKFDVLAWGADFGAVARFSSKPTQKQIDKAFKGIPLDVVKTEIRK